MASDNLQGVLVADYDAAAIGDGSVADLLRQLQRGDITSREVAETHLRRIADRPDLNAFLWADPDVVLGQRRPRRGSGFLAGLPIALKDNIDTAGVPTTSGSVVDRGRIPRINATAWKRLRDVAGATLLGKTHMCEFAYRVHHPAFGWVRNPRNTARATGGSSSGSAAAVAAGLAPVAIGSDTGGSVRIPAAYCGVVGLKGTHGLIENDALVPLSPTMDHYGVLARSVTDVAIVFEQMASRQLHLVDHATFEVAPANPRRLRVGLERDYFTQRTQPAVFNAWSRAVGMVESAGARVTEIKLPDADRWRAAHKTILLAEAWAYHGDRLRRGAPYGPVFRTAVTAGRDITRKEYHVALEIRRSASRTMSKVFEEIDIILTPTCPTVAPAIEEGRRNVGYTRFTTLAAFAGLPAISIPMGTGYLGLPVGAQLIAGWNHEKKLVAAARLLEDLLK
jgi:aspartyl-tRNA(Asn)/glutamyl-tRNA(Gln) amidotransferase subunit A